MRPLCLLFPTLVALPALAQHPSNTKTKAAAKPAAVVVASKVEAAPVPLPPSPQKLDQHYGFRGLRLETDSATVPGLSHERRDAGLSYCRRETDSLTWAGTAVEAPRYAFYRGKLLSLSFGTKGAASSHAVLARLQALYGPGEQKGSQQRYVWRGEKTLLRYEESSTNNNAVITLTSLPLTIKRQQDVSGVIEQTASNR